MLPQQHRCSQSQNNVFFISVGMNLPKPHGTFFNAAKCKWWRWNEKFIQAYILIGRIKICRNHLFFCVVSSITCVQNCWKFISECFCILICISVNSNACAFMYLIIILNYRYTQFRTSVMFYFLKMIQSRPPIEERTTSLLSVTR